MTLVLQSKQLKQPLGLVTTTPLQPLAANSLCLALSTIGQLQRQYWVANTLPPGIASELLVLYCEAASGYYIKFTKLRLIWKSLFSNWHSLMYIIKLKWYLACNVCDDQSLSLYTTVHFPPFVDFAKSVMKKQCQSRNCCY